MQTLDQKMRTLTLLLAVGFLAACGKPASETTPRLRVHKAGWRTATTGDDRLGYQGAYILVIEDAPATFIAWHLTDGKKTKVGEAAFDPAIHGLAYVTSFFENGKAYIDFSTRPKNVLGPKEYVEFSLELPMPFGMGSFDSELHAPLDEKVTALKIWITESSETELSVPDGMVMDTMLQSSRRKGLSFFVIEAVAD